MSDKPEATDDIIREMRTFGERCNHMPFSWQMVDGLLRRLADRIEAVAERQRAHEEAIRINECIVSRKEEAAEWRKRIGDAAAMREALKETSELVWSSIDPECNNDCCRPLRRIARIADAALSAPARNCDKYGKGEVLDAFIRDTAEGTLDPDTAGEDDVDEYMREHWFLFRIWLFATAEGGAE